MITHKHIINYFLPKIKCYYGVVKYDPNTFLPICNFVIKLHDDCDYDFKDYVELRFGSNMVKSPKYEEMCRELFKSLITK